MPLSVLIVLGLIGIYLIIQGNAGVKAQAAEQARTVEDPDGATLDELARAGSDLTHEHLIEFYLYFPTEAAAAGCATILAQEGFATQVSQAEGKKDWTLLASRRMRPELAPLRAVRDRLTALVAEHGGEYDGWGTEVEGNHDDS